MMARISEIVRQRARPLQPKPTGVPSILQPLGGVRAVLFDVYGTLFISGSGDVGTANPEGEGSAFSESLAALGLDLTVPGAEGVSCLQETIRSEHARMHQQGVLYPEVNIVDIWRKTIDKLVAQGRLAADCAASLDLWELSAEYEMRANPVWPMPHAGQCLQGLHGNGLRLGIVSNAQFFTCHLFPALLGRSASELGFDPDLQFYSYQHGWAKPGEYLYRRASEALAARGIAAKDALYIGNDMLNDILPAQSLGFRTALFAGDARSLRRREQDPRVQGLTPDLVVTDLRELNHCLSHSVE